MSKWYPATELPRGYAGRRAWVWRPGERKAEIGWVPEFPTMRRGEWFYPIEVPELPEVAKPKKLMSVVRETD